MSQEPKKPSLIIAELYDDKKKRHMGTSTVDARTIHIGLDATETHQKFQVSLKTNSKALRDEPEAVKVKLRYMFDELLKAYFNSIQV